MKILIDNGHGSNTSGKRSPDGKLREYAYTREIAQMLVDKLNANGYDAQRITPETQDVSLTERCRRANKICDKYGAKNCVLVSIHLDASPGSGWQKARGFSVRVSNNASQNSKRLARILTETAIELRLMGNRSIPAEKYWVQNLAICRDVACPAVLTENLFMTSKEDVEYLLSQEGKNAVMLLHYYALMKYIGDE